MRDMGYQKTVADPIFICGLSFSGKTILHLMLSRHPNIVITRHSSMWTRYYERFGDLKRPENLERCLSTMLQSKHIQGFHPDINRIRREFNSGLKSYGRLFALFHEHNAERLGKLRWGDQSSSLERYAAPIFAAYPDARIIHMIRDPRDRFWATTRSLLSWKWKVGWETESWLSSLRLARLNHSHYPDKYKVLRYEALLSDPYKIINEICQFINEDFDPEMLKLDLERQLDDEYDQERDSGKVLISNGRITRRGRYRGTSKREIALIQAYAGHEMLTWEYLPESIELSLRDRLVYYLIDWPAGMVGMGVRHTWSTNLSAFSQMLA